MVSPSKIPTTLPEKSSAWANFLLTPSIHLSCQIPDAKVNRSINALGQREEVLRPLVGSRDGAWDASPGFHPLPPRTVHEVFPHTALRQPSSWGVQGYALHTPAG